MARRALSFEEYFWFYYVFAVLFGVVSLLDLGYKVLFNTNSLLWPAFKSSIEIMFLVLSIVVLIYFIKKKYSLKILLVPLSYCIVSGVFLVYSMLILVLYIIKYKFDLNQTITMIVGIAFYVYLLFILIFSIYLIYAYKKKDIFSKISKKLLLIILIILANSEVINITTSESHNTNSWIPALMAIIELGSIILTIILIKKIVKKR